MIRYPASDKIINKGTKAKPIRKIREATQHKSQSEPTYMERKLDRDQQEKGKMSLHKTQIK